MAERVAIVGSRPEHDPRKHHSEHAAAIARDKARCRAIDAFVAALPADTIVVSGGAPGADTWADNAAKRYGLQRIVIPAAWQRRDGSTDKGAGFRRNALIVELADRVVAFFGAAPSPGTDSTCEIARRAGKAVEVHRG